MLLGDKKRPLRARQNKILAFCERKKKAPAGTPKGNPGFLIKKRPLRARQNEILAFIARRVYPQVYKRLESGSVPNTRFKYLGRGPRLGFFLNPQKSIRGGWGGEVFYKPEVAIILQGNIQGNIQYNII